MTGCLIKRCANQKNSIPEPCFFYKRLIPLDLFNYFRSVGDQYGIKNYKSGIRPGICLFTLALLIGLFTYKDYGISYDEGQMRNLGIYTYDYAFHAGQTIKTSDNKEHGVAMELPLILLEKILGLKDSRKIFLMRHLLTHLFFLAGCLAFFLLTEFLFGSTMLAVLGFFLLLLNPLIYGHSFFNTTDIPFMSMFMITMLVGYTVLQRKTTLGILLLGLTCGVLCNIRIMGLMLVAGFLFLFLFDLSKQKREGHFRKKMLLQLLLFPGSAFMALYATWPYLYPNPLGNLISVIKTMSSYPWKGDVVFAGHFYKYSNLPLDYSIGWFCISNPLVYLGLGFFGLGLTGFRLAAKPSRFGTDPAFRFLLLNLLWFVAPLLAIAILHSVVYDAWRHLYFIYPSFVLMGLYGLNSLPKPGFRYAVLLLLVLNMAQTAWFMVNNFPNEHIYFNRIPRQDQPNRLRSNYDLDYWGTSYKQALEYILQTDTSSLITVKVIGLAGKENAWLLKSADRRRIHFTEDISKANYFASYYRYHPGDYPFMDKEVFSVKVLGSTIMSVFKLN